MSTVDQKIDSIRITIHLIVFAGFTMLLNEWALGLAVSAFSRCYINKFAEKTYSFIKGVSEKTNR